MSFRHIVDALADDGEKDKDNKDDDDVQHCFNMHARSFCPPCRTCDGG